VLAKHNIRLPVSDLESGLGTALLDQVWLMPAYLHRLESQRRQMLLLETEIGQVEVKLDQRLKHHPDYRNLQKIKGIGPVIAAVLVAEIGDITRFGGPDQLACWAGLTPRHYASDHTTRRGHISKEATPWSAGPPSKRSSATANPPWSSCGSGSWPAAAPVAGTSPRSPRRIGCSTSSPTPCATAPPAPCSTPTTARTRRDPELPVAAGERHGPTSCWCGRRSEWPHTLNQGTNHTASCTLAGEKMPGTPATAPSTNPKPPTTP